MASVGIARGLGWGAFSLALMSACGSPEAPLEDELSYVLSDEQCDNLLEIDTQSVRLDSIEGPSKAQQALDAVDPAAADLSQYLVVFAIEQSFENLLDRPLIVEEANATLSDAESTSSYQASYALDAPIELAPHETRSSEFLVEVPADQLSPSYLFDLVQGAALGMTIAPELRVSVPNSDNCGYPEGMLVRGKEGTVEVRRPVSPGVASEVLSGVLKAFAHSGK